MKKLWIIFGFSCIGLPVAAQSDHTLWFAEPASYFEETLVLGNGKTGASVFGGVEKDSIYLNDATLWSGEPVNANMNPDAYKAIPEIRAALARGDYKLADELQKKVQGKFSESYAPLGTLILDFEAAEKPVSYRRDLDISDAVSSVTYTLSGVTYKREYFVSHPAGVLVIRITSSQKGALNFSVRFGSRLRFKTSAAAGRLSIAGYAPVHADPNYLGDRPNALVFDEQRGTRFAGLVAIRSTGGKVTATDTSLICAGGTVAEVLVSLATSFNGFDKNPATEGADAAGLAKSSSPVPWVSPMKP